VTVATRTRTEPDGHGVPAAPDRNGMAAGAERDWRVTLRRASDLALVGVAATVVSLSLVAAGAAAVTASVAVHRLCDEDDLPSAGVLWRVLVRALVPGALVSAVAAGVAALLAVNASAIAAGAVPGGTLGLVVTGVAAALLLGFAILAVAELGARGGRGWRVALAATIALTRAAPAAVPAAAGAAGAIAALAWLLPPGAPVLPGFLLFAAHALRRRWLP
jgi:hypothetical protein